MAEASVTIKATPQEFDLLREALACFHDGLQRDGSPSITPDAGERQKIRSKALLVQDLGVRLGA